MDVEPVIGFEVHVEPKTRAKMFCRCSADYFGKEPNTHTCPVCLGLPGAMPVPNKAAVTQCMTLGLALGCEIREHAVFERKHYFYPDLPKGFQISQYGNPFCTNGTLKVNKSTISIQRVHLEEDTAKMIHVGKETWIDFNRSGIPLIEIVSGPDFRSAEDIRLALQKLQQIIRYIDVSSGDMEKGTMRCEVNVSVRKKSAKLPRYRVEVKNLNSFRSVEQALLYEIDRQRFCLHRGNPLMQETRGWDERTRKTVTQRTKEAAHDYRYFPEPDIPPIKQTKKEIDVLQKSLPELPDASIERFIRQYGVTRQEAELLVETREGRDFFEELLRIVPDQKHRAKTWMVGELRRRLREGFQDIAATKLEPAAFAELIVLIERGEITQATAKELLPKMMAGGMMPRKLMEETGKGQVSDAATLQKVVTTVILGNPKAVQDYRAGRKNAKYFLLGQVQRVLEGKADIMKASKLLEEALRSS